MNRPNDEIESAARELAVEFMTQYVEFSFVYENDRVMTWSGEDQIKVHDRIQEILTETAKRLEKESA